MAMRESRVRVKRPPSKLRRRWWLVPAGIVIALIAWTVTGPEWSRPRTGKTSDTGPLPGYVTAFSAVQQEYQRFYGKPLHDDSVRAKFQAAGGYMAGRNYGAAVQTLDDLT